MHKSILVTKCLILTVFIFAQNVAARQTRLIDSLEQLAKTTPVDSIRLQALGDLCWNLGTIDFIRALHYGEEELKLAQKLGNQPAIALAYSDIGNTYTRINQFDKALEFHLKSYMLRDKLGLKAKAAGSVSNIAVIYKQQGRYKEAIEYMTRALKIYEEFGDEPRQALVLGNIGNVYLDYKKFEDAKSHFQRAIDLAKKYKSNVTLANSYAGMLQYYFQVNQFDKALQYARLAESMFLKSSNKTDLAVIYNSIGQIYYERMNYDEAMRNFKLSLSMREAMNDQMGIGSCYKNMAMTYGKRKDFKKAEEYMNLAINIFREINSKDYLREAYSKLGQIQEEGNNLESSLASYKMSTALRDSIYDRKTTDRINELQIAYETERKAKQIILLNKDNKIQKLLLDKARITTGLIAGALILLVLFGFIFYNRYKLRQENKLQNEVIKQQDLATRAVLIAEENERRRISGELHDGLGQMFSAVKLNLSGIAENISFRNDHSKLMFGKTLDLVDESCKEVRVISHQMAPNVLLKSGLASAIRDFIDKIDAQKLLVKLETFGLTQRLDENIETVLYRVIQETVNNVIKHAKANKLDIQLNRDESGIDVMIEDNGIGFDLAKTGNKEGIGLKNIRSRIDYLKGTVDFSSAPGNGTLVAIHIPL